MSQREAGIAGWHQSGHGTHPQLVYQGQRALTSLPRDCQTSSI